jgi:hypothetical protein
MIQRWESAYRKDKRAAVVDFRALAGSSIVPDRYTHLIHSYPAKLLPQIPKFRTFFFIPPYSRAERLEPS